ARREHRCHLEHGAQFQGPYGRAIRPGLSRLAVHRGCICAHRAHYRSARAAAVKAWVFGDNVDTDVIAPGRYMKYGIDEIARHCMEAMDPSFAAAVKQGDVVVAGRNFGAGSSREQAPEALKHLGVA